jgi:hypothetical protein
VFGTEHKAITLGHQVEGAVGPSVEVARSAQSLAGMTGPTLAHVMDDEDGEVVIALELA